MEAFRTIIQKLKIPKSQSLKLLETDETAKKTLLSPWKWLGPHMGKGSSTGQGLQILGKAYQSLKDLFNPRIAGRQPLRQGLLRNHRQFLLGLRPRNLFTSI